ncbi:family 61 glycoside hydrolase [Cryphonectria parasitica EP155]|uniref:lytic cellulose monooxygenase (C4-dehydrogenating) n=1 Tax=Cryphonectria parasitica (strain ATCC 38755 / EP155) TaxID=660469 RepID=A0A9P5CL91_CRYP1|nr:family 61 glycoside hydrolase [Cryphonectria parasitica EP155]KAF3761585.1 family 61 glycoside hydrolase [Cryphonectria parasitica EP155]
MHSSTSFLAAAAFLPAAFAHYNFEALIVNGNITSPYEYVRQTNNSNSPITDITSTNMICNSGGLLASTMAQTSTYTVAPGDNVGFTVDVSISHPGPLSVWMSKAPSGTTADQYDGSGDWFKIYELTTYEITSAGLQWATYIPGTSGIQNFTVDLPTELAAGDYLLRAEHIALHAAEEFEGAQYYIGCAQLTVTGSGSGTPSPLTTIPGQYTGYEPGIEIDIYYPIPTNYTAPGISTWPEACVSHWPNLVDQTYYGMCFNSEFFSLPSLSLPLSFI